VSAFKAVVRHSFEPVLPYPARLLSQVSPGNR
jgi:hypothetical protein